MKITKTLCDRCGKDCSEDRRSTYDRDLCDSCYQLYLAHEQKVKDLESKFWKQDK